MRIGIVGSGKVGRALGVAWSRLGHSVFFGMRKTDADDVARVLADAATTARAGSVQQAAEFGEVVLLATPWAAAREALREAGDLTGKIVVDAVNPLQPQLTGLALDGYPSAGEAVAQWAAGAHVVKCFNTVGANIMADSAFPQGKAALFYCGDDAEAKRTVARLAAELGFDALDAGPLAQARLLEPFALLWISLAVKHGYGRDIAFQLMRRTPAMDSSRS